MSEQTDTQQGDQAKPNLLDTLMNAGIDIETIVPMLSSLEDLIVSINEIPAQLELSARATLATKFIQCEGESYTFHRNAFERVWAVVADYETDQKEQERS